MSSGESERERGHYRYNTEFKVRSPHANLGQFCCNLSDKDVPFLCAPAFFPPRESEGRRPLFGTHFHQERDIAKISRPEMEKEERAVDREERSDVMISHIRQEKGNT